MEAPAKTIAKLTLAYKMDKSKQKFRDTIINWKGSFGQNNAKLNGAGKSVRYSYPP